MKFAVLLLRSEVVLIAVSLVAMLLFFIFASRTIPTTFDVIAQTERLEFTSEQSKHKPQSRWTFEHIEVTESDSTSPFTFTGEFEPADSVKVVVDRVALGPLWIHVDAVGQESSAGNFYTEDGEFDRKAAKSVDLVIADISSRANSGETVVIPVTGMVSLGRTVGIETPGSTAILRSGKVTMLERSLFEGNIFEADSVVLDAGAMFKVDDPASPALGFIVADERPAFTAAYRVVGNKASVTRAGGGVYPLSVSFLKRLLYDHFFQALSLFFGVLVVIATLLNVLLDWRIFRRESMSCGGEAGSIRNRKDKHGKSAKALAWFLFFLCLQFSVTTFAQEVYVQAGEHGQGVLRKRKSECFVITPYHVVKTTAGNIQIIGSRTMRSEGTLVEAYEEPVDLAIVRLEGSLECPVWQKTDFSKMENQFEGILSIREDDGSLSMIPVSLRNIGPEFIKIKMKNPSDTFQKTMSGASLIVDKNRAGILLNFCMSDKGCENGFLQKGEGLVFRIDAVMAKLEPFFGVAPMLSTAVAQSILDRVIETRDGSVQGQVEAIESLIARGHKFVHADLSGISLQGANLSSGVFEGAKLHALDLTGVIAKKADFSRSGLRFANLTRARMSQVNLSQAYAPFVVGKDAVFENANLSGANFFAADFQNADFRNADLRGAAFAYADLRGAKFDGANLTGAYFNGALLEGATFVNAKIKNTDFDGIAIGRVSLTRKQKKGACRHNKSKLLEWNIDLLEKWPSNKYSTGYQFETIQTKDWFLKNLADKSLPLCTKETATSKTAGFDVQFAGYLGVHLDRAYLSKAGRRSLFRNRVENHLEFLKSHISKVLKKK